MRPPILNHAALSLFLVTVLAGNADAAQVVTKAAPEEAHADCVIAGTRQVCAQPCQGLHGEVLFSYGTTADGDPENRGQLQCRHGRLIGKVTVRSLVDQRPIVIGEMHRDQFVVKIFDQESQQLVEIAKYSSTGSVEHVIFPYSSRPDLAEVSDHKSSDVRVVNFATGEPFTGIIHEPQGQRTNVIKFRNGAEVESRLY